jgi:hypothetical protein
MTLNYDHEKTVGSSSHHGDHVYKFEDPGTYGSFSISTTRTTQPPKREENVRNFHNC